MARSMDFKHSETASPRPSKAPQDASLPAEWHNYIDGSWVDGGKAGRITVENPATGQPLAEIAAADADAVDRAVRAARRALPAFRALQPVDRAAMLFRIARELNALEDKIGLAECLDNGKRLSHARTEAAGAARYFEYYGGLADKIEGRSIPLGTDYVDYTVAEPYGVTAHIVPWNYPLNIAARSVSAALATGNTAVVKSPELSPLSVALLAEACDRAEVPPGVINIICGYGSVAGATLVEHPEVDLIIFTGSVPTGKSILRAAAQRVIPCIMELGGKSAGIVYPDADLEQAVASTLVGIFSNAGQICSAASRLLVHQSLYERVVERLVECTTGLSVGPGIEEHDITPLISAPQLDRVEAMCRTAIQAGATAVCGGQRADRSGHFMLPTVLTRVSPDMAIAQQEVFGPVLAVLPFETREEAVQLANGTDYGLVAGIYTRDLDLAHWTARQLVAGQVFVNEWFAGGVETPFGGTRRSGYGREKGQEALLNYVQTKNVAIRLFSGS